MVNKLLSSCFQIQWRWQKYAVLSHNLLEIYYSATKLSSTEKKQDKINICINAIIAKVRNSSTQTRNNTD